MPRITIADVRQSRMPSAVGLCSGNTPEICKYINEAQQRLIEAGGEQGFWGSWSRVVFPVSVGNPYITLPRQFARIINMDVCRHPIRINNEFYEMLPDGIGLMPDFHIPCWQGNIAGYERGVFPTMVDLPGTSFLRAYISDARDVNARMMITGLDQNGNQIYFQDTIDNVNGFFLQFIQPFVTSPFTVSAIQAIQKDITYGDVVLKAVDPVTSVETTLSRYAPTEQNPAYRRYFIKQLPDGCCVSQSLTVPVTAIAKLEWVPVYLDSDQLIIQSIPALIEECQSIRYLGMDTSNGAAMATQHHRNAIKLLQNQMRHMMGEQSPAVNVDRFQGAPLARQSIGTMI